MIKYNYTLTDLYAIRLASNMAMVKLQWEASDELSRIIDYPYVFDTCQAFSRDLPEINERMKGIIDLNGINTFIEEISSLSSKYRLKEKKK